MARSLKEVIKKNRAIGNHFFSKDTMEGFNSKIHNKFLINDRYFITSEDDFYRTKELFSIREALQDGNIETIGLFQGFNTYQKAKEYIDLILVL